MIAASRRLMQMGALFTGSNATRMGIAFATSVVVARGAGLHAFGDYTLLMVWASALTMAFDLGFGVMVAREAGKRRTPIGALVSGAVATRLAAFAPFGVLVYAAAPWIGLRQFDHRWIAAVVCLASAGIGYGPFGAALRASPRWLPAVLAVEIGGALTLFSGAVWVVNAGADTLYLLWLAAIVQCTQIVAVVTLWPVAMAGDPLRFPSLGMSKGLVRRAFPFALQGLLSNAQARLGPIALGVMAGSSDIAAYGAASRIQGAAQIVPHSGFAGALPVYSREVGSGNAPALRSAFDGVLRGFAGAAALVLIIGATPLIRGIYGAPFLGAVAPLMWLGAGLLPGLVNGGHRVYLHAQGFERTVAAWSGLALVLQVLGCAVLIPAYGAAGAAAAMTIGEAAVWWPLARATARADDRENRGERLSIPHRGSLPIVEPLRPDVRV